MTCGVRLPAQGAAPAAPPAAPPSSETARLSALERLRRAAAEAEGKSNRSTPQAPAAAASQPSSSGPAAVAAAPAASGNALERLREELRRAESSILANGARVAGKPAAAPAPAPETPTTGKRKASPVREASPPRGPDGQPLEPAAGQEQPAAEAKPAPTMMGAPLSAVEKLRQALEDTNSKLDDKKACLLVSTACAAVICAGGCLEADISESFGQASSS